MAKNILAFFGLVFLTLLILGGVVILAGLYDSLGMVPIPAQVKDLAAKVMATSPAKVFVQPGSQPEWSNPLEALPIVTLTAEPVEPTAIDTPIPPLEPEVYRTETILQLKRLVAALERWLEANSRLAQDNRLVKDPAWSGEMETILQEIEQSGSNLGNVGPAPQEYQTIDSLLDSVSSEAQELSVSYRDAVAAAAPTGFTDAGMHFTRLKGYLESAVEEMVKQGWSMEQD
jgi:hypothetical protein